MDTALDVQVASGYSSPSRRIRVITEAWFAKAMFCVACPAQRLVPAPRNARVVDFRCEQCGAEYQLKSTSRAVRGRLRDAAYSPMMERVLGNRTPHFAFLQYDAGAWVIRNLILVPSHFITSSVIERCRPLSGRARRHGWTGCNILLELIPPDGRLSAVSDGRFRSPDEVRREWERFKWLSGEPSETRGWLADVLRCVRSLGDSFTLADVYNFEDELARLDPGNRHIRDKVRQQLQVLRDKGIVRFLGRGRYQLL